MSQTLQLRAKEKGYYSDDIIVEGQVFTWTVPEWSLSGKDKCSLEKAIPPWAEPVGDLPKEKPSLPSGDELTDDQREAKIINIVQGLDHSDDDHWTEGGEPLLEKVSELCGFRVRRSEVKSLLPGFEREDQE